MSGRFLEKSDAKTFIINYHTSQDVITMIIKGLQKTTLLDFPTKVACTVFTPGCNFRCPFCHNASLVIEPDCSETVDTDDFFSYLKKRKGILDGVCITGGEPLLQKDIDVFMRDIHDLGLAVKLDTNGSFPDKLAALIDEKLVDYVAMDIKTSVNKYPIVCGTDKFTDNVIKSVDILMNSNIDFEFRTTAVRELHDIKDFEDIGKWIQGAPKYFLQQFKDSGDLIEKEVFTAYTKEEMEEILEVTKKYIPSASLRGV